MQTIECFSSDEFVTKASSAMEQIICEAQRERGTAVIALSGGSTPGPVYAALGRSTAIDWSQVWILLADDRYIRIDSPKNNQYLLRSTLLRDAPVPNSHIVAPDPSLPLEDAVRKYDHEVSVLTEKRGLDLLILGMGDDGHIASLFPPLTDNAFGPAAAIHTTTEVFDVRDRISLTLPLLGRTKNTFLFLKGLTKKNVLRDMLAAPEGPSRWPLKALHPERESMTVFIEL